jgi:hypothetical protein
MVPFILIIHTQFLMINGDVCVNISDPLHGSEEQGQVFWNALIASSRSLQYGPSTILSSSRQSSARGMMVRPPLKAVG